MKLERLSDVFWKVCPNLYFAAVISGVITGLAYSALVPFIMYAIGIDVSIEVDTAGRTFSFFDSPTATLATAFLAVCVGVVLLKGLSGMLSMYVANRASMEHRLWLYERIRGLRYADLERVGSARLINLLNLDIPRITSGALAQPQIWISAVTIAGVLGYLTQLNARVFLFVLGCLVVAIVTYQLPLLAASHFARRAREHMDQVQQGVTGLVHGAKELRLNRRKAQAFLDQDLRTPERRALRDGSISNGLFVFTQSYGDVLSFAIVGIVVFQFRYSFGLTPSELMGIAMALLYLTGPVSLILLGVGDLQMGQVSLRKLQSFYEDLSKESEEGDAPIADDWQELKVEGLGYEYGGSDAGFALQEVNLTIARGEVTFIVGGNGSGKSTLGKCLSFLYVPTSGQIRLGTTAVGLHNLPAAREQVSAIFPDFHLFQKLYAERTPEEQARIAVYLKYLELDTKVSVTDDRFSTVELSTGQRKRLALLVMLLENRPLYLFDEWAADQDPHFKNVFYSVVLPDLKERGAAVIVVSHDDRYFCHADKVVVMECGRVLDVTRPVVHQAPPPRAAQAAA